MQENYYSGVGSRENKLPKEVAGFMTKFARFMAARNFTLRSGHASGSDHAFELGAGHKAEIYLPWNGFNSELDLAQNHTCQNYITLELTDKHKEMVDKIHALGYEKLGHAAKSFHSRNVTGGTPFILYRGLRCSRALLFKSVRLRCRPLNET